MKTFKVKDSDGTTIGLGQRVGDDLVEIRLFPGQAGGVTWTPEVGAVSIASATVTVGRVSECGAYERKAVTWPSATE